MCSLYLGLGEKMLKSYGTTVYVARLWDRSQHTFSVKDQRASNLDFAGRVVSVPTTQLCSPGSRVAQATRK